MRPRDYLELCRRFISEQFGVRAADVDSREINNPFRKVQSAYRHHIDLYWITEDPLARYVHIAHVKWRKGGAVGLDKVLLLQKVKEKVAAHKAVLITNAGFTRPAIAAADDEGISLFIVRPPPRARARPLNRRKPFEFDSPWASASLYLHEVVR